MFSLRISVIFPVNKIKTFPSLHQRLVTFGGHSGDLGAALFGSPIQTSIVWQISNLVVEARWVSGAKDLSPPKQVLFYFMDIGLFLSFDSLIIFSPT